MGKMKKVKRKPSLSSRKNKGRQKHKRLASLAPIGHPYRSLWNRTAQSSRRKRKKQPSPAKSPWKVDQKKPEDHEKKWVGKYAQYFKGNEILPIPEIIEKLEPRILSLVVTDLKTRRLVGLKRRFRRPSPERRHPLSIHLSPKFCNLGRSTTFKRASSESSIFDHHNQVLPRPCVGV